MNPGFQISLKFWKIFMSGFREKYIFLMGCIAEKSLLTETFDLHSSFNLTPKTDDKVWRIKYLYQSTVILEVLFTAKISLLVYSPVY